jgi:putative transposase
VILTSIDIWSHPSAWPKVRGVSIDLLICQTKAALARMKKALKRHGSPEAITTDGLRSNGAPLKELSSREKQEVGRWANNRVENSHLPFRRRERAMLRFRRMRTPQKFASVHATVHAPFHHERHLVDRQAYKKGRSEAPAEWKALVS